MTKRMMAAASALLVLGGLQACCFGSGEASGNGYAAAAPEQGPAGTLEITDWGPRETAAGDPFNVQSGGQAAIWFKVDRPPDGWIAQVRFDDAVLEADWSGGLVTAVVPEALYARRGSCEVRVVARKAGGLRMSDPVRFTVR